MKPGFTFWRNLASFKPEIPELELLPHQAKDLVKYLKKLAKTKDFYDEKIRPNLANRVMTLMELLTEDKKIRNDAMDHIHHALSSCGDRIALALDDLETMK